MAAAVCRAKGWDLIGTRFYTGVPDPSDDPFWNHFWSGKLAVMGRTPAVNVFSRALRYRNQVVTLPNGTQSTFLKGEEKGIDVRIALDVIRLAHRRELDVALAIATEAIKRSRVGVQICEVLIA